jgi:hypothetical protein
VLLPRSLRGWIQSTLEDGPLALRLGRPFGVPPAATPRGRLGEAQNGSFIPTIARLLTWPPGIATLSV